MIKRRNPFLAFLLGIIPGLGQLYNGQIKKTVLLIALDFILLIFFYFTEAFMSVAGISIFIIFSIGLLLYRTIDAFLVAQRSKSYELKTYNEWYIYILYIAVFSLNTFMIKKISNRSIQSFNIPSSAMEPAIMVGDRIIAQLGYYTNHEMKRNDLVVFHYPAEIEKPIDEKTYYISRCVAIPGDTLSIVNRKIYINSQLSADSIDLRYKYKCFTESLLSENIKKKNGIHSYDIFPEDIIKVGDKSLYLIDLNLATVEKLRSKKIFDSIVPFNMEELDYNNMLFPYSNESSNWTNNNYGPLWIPKKGATITLDQKTIKIYGQTILKYEGKKSIELAGSTLIIDGKPVSAYTFKQNYYFTMGDNRDNSSDGRVWGFVPEDHLVGKAWLVLYSKDASEGYKSDRIFVPIK